MTSPALVRMTEGRLAALTDPCLRERRGIVVAFTERTGGVSDAPYTSLDLAAHVGDDPLRVDVNRARVLDALGIGRLTERLTCSEQVHGQHLAEVGTAEVGAGSRAAGGRAPLPATDALLTTLEDAPLLLCFADCVPVVIVAPEPVRAVAVVHAGWRGALAKLPGKAAAALAAKAGCAPSSLLAYVGPHICAECYPVGEDVLSQFTRVFGTIVAAQGRLNLGAVVSGSLTEAGVLDSNIVDAGICTAEQTARFFSYRSEGVTGRHGALGAVLSEEG